MEAAPAAPDAPAAPLQQPDFHRLQQYIAGVVEQIGLLPNMPAVVGFNAIIVNLREQHDQALAQRAQQHAAALAQQAEHHTAALAQAAQQAQHHEAALAQQAERHQELIERLDALRDGQSRLPMQLQNAIASLDAPLQYPPNVVVGPQFPTTKKLLLKLTRAWDDVKVMAAPNETEQVSMAQVLLSMRSGDPNATTEALRTARNILEAPIAAAAGVTRYRRAYEAVLNLHLMHELEAIHSAITGFPTDSHPRSQTQKRKILATLSQNLAARLDATLPTFRTREPILSIRRTSFALIPTPRQILMREASRSWIASAKIARKAGQWQTAYSAMLQAQQGASDIAFVESAKLVKARDGPGIDLTADDESKAITAKAHVLRARWMHELESFELSYIYKIFCEAAETLPTWESCHFRLGQFHDECFKALPSCDKIIRGLKMNQSTVKSYAKAIKAGSKYVYQTVPRILTIWLDLAEDEEANKRDQFKKLNEIVFKAIRELPAYKWYTAFPQPDSLMTSLEMLR
ncbi:hypothetical protein F5887DRAFT_1286899 [Amanita rubescens]|nr:hypothetical protein F5887DRAFT_1286899 [Amanita rubescens]